MKAAFVVAFLALAACSQAYDALPSLGADTTQTTLSGISSGAFFSFQFHVAYSANVTGAAGIAGGPFYCSQGQITNSFLYCMYATMPIDVDTLVAKAKSYESSGDIDATSNLANDKVWVYSGTADTVVNPKVVKTVPTFYQSFISDSSNIAEEYSIASEHAWITDGEGNSCGQLGSPYINNCNYDAAGKILAFFYGNLKDKVDPVSSNLVQFDQTEFTSSLNDYGYAYIPTGCKSSGAKCPIHVSFHGCQMEPSAIQDQFETKGGLEGWAEANDIIVLYPQTKTDILKGNPEGCFDWWGYSGSNYATKSGAQMSAVYSMLERLAGQS